MTKKPKKAGPPEDPEGESQPEAEQAPEPTPREDHPDRRLREFLQGRFPGEALPAGVPPVNEEEPSSEDTNTGEKDEEEKEAGKGNKKTPRKPSDR